jgi:hypothetical protein
MCQQIGVTLVEVFQRSPGEVIVDTTDLKGYKTKLDLLLA